MKFYGALAVVLWMSTPVSSQELPGFREDFDYLDPDVWSISTYASPGRIDGHSGFYAEENVSIVDGYLRLELNQQKVDGGYLSMGGSIKSSMAFGYGTYEIRMRTSSTSPTPDGVGDSVTGSVSAAFVYADGADTEIDVEVEGKDDSAVTHFLTWVGEDVDNEHSIKRLPGKAPYEGFYTYRVEWFPDGVWFYRDDELVAHHETVVPSTPGYIIFNHWGTNSKWWGGVATADQPRYLYVDYVLFTPVVK